MPEFRFEQGDPVWCADSRRWGVVDGETDSDQVRLVVQEGDVDAVPFHVCRLVPEAAVTGVVR